MKLCKIEIRNFRSIHHLKLWPREMVTFIGKNSCGKSNILRSLDFFFSAKPTLSDTDDICQFADDAGTWVECTFNELTAAEADALQKYVLRDGSIRVRRTVKREGEKCRTELNGYTTSVAEEWLQEGFEGYADMDGWAARGINVQDYAALGRGSKLTKAGFAEFRQKYIEKHQSSLTLTEALSDTEFKGRQSTAASVLPHFVFVPAVGDIASVICGKQSSLLNEIVAALIDSARSDTTFAAAQENMVLVQGLINPSSNRLHKLVQIEQDIEARLKSWPGTKVSIRTQLDDLAKLLVSGLTIDVFDGHNTDLASKGDGIQRQILFRVFQLYADFRAKRGVFKPDGGETVATAAPSIIAFEEPELFLHPQAQEQFYDDLLVVSETDQVLLATHSSHLIRLDSADGLHIVRRAGPGAPTVVITPDKDWLAEDERLRLKEMNLCTGEASKVFFADRVVLTEGQEDLIYINGTARDHASCLDRRVTVIETRSKESIPTLQRVLNAFQLPYTVACDRDPGNPSSEATTEKIKKHIAKANENVPGLASLELFDPDLPSECQGRIVKVADKPAEAFRFIREEVPSEAFRARVSKLFSF